MKSGGSGVTETQLGFTTKREANRSPSLTVQTAYNRAGKDEEYGAVKAAIERRPTGEQTPVAHLKEALKPENKHGAEHDESVREQDSSSVSQGCSTLSSNSV